MPSKPLKTSATLRRTIPVKYWWMSQTPDIELVLTPGVGFLAAERVVDITPSVTRITDTTCRVEYLGSE